MKKIILSIDGMTCSACSSGLEKYLNKQDGVISASVNLVLAQALIEYEDNLTIEQLELLLKKQVLKLRKKLKICIDFLFLQKI